MINHAQIIGALCKPKERALLNQMFTAENFRRIFDKENRKGHDIAGRFFKDVETINTNIRRLHNGEIQMASEEDLETRIDDLKQKKSELIDTKMKELSDAVSKPDFKLNLTLGKKRKGKAVYCIDESAEAFFVMKQLQENIHRLYKVKPSSRHSLTCQLRDAIDSEFPFELVRTDISNFYESIDRKSLYSQLDEDQLLSSPSKKLIRQIFASYAKLNNNNEMGIPRGVGISAYLAEFSLRDVDRDIANLPGNILYCRYVDDIVAVFAKLPTSSKDKTYEERIIEIIKKYKFTHNESKTKYINFKDKNGTETFEYLGYKFIKVNGHLKIAPSDAKVKKLRQRIDAAFNAYNRASPKKSKKAFRELVARVKFLTGNTRLKHSKSNATTGIYYNSPLVTDPRKFQSLDKRLQHYINKTGHPKLQKKLHKYGFKSGFDERRFHNFSTKELENIVKVWKNV